jgi:hypothetical protein
MRAARGVGLAFGLWRARGSLARRSATARLSAQLSWRDQGRARHERIRLAPPKIARSETSARALARRASGIRPLNGYNGCCRLNHIVIEGLAVSYRAHRISCEESSSCFNR